MIIVAFIESSLCDRYYYNHFTLCYFKYHNHRRYKPYGWDSDRSSKLPKVIQLVSGRGFKTSLTGVSLTSKSVPEGGKRTLQITHRVSRPPLLPLCSVKLKYCRVLTPTGPCYWALRLFWANLNPPCPPAGLSWHDDLTQYVISQEMERIPRLRPPELHPRDR